MTYLTASLALVDGRHDGVDADMMPVTGKMVGAEEAFCG
jgi:hypothetical protein